MNYKTTKKVLDNLSRLLFEISLKEIQIKNANGYNRRNSIKELEIDVQDIITERDELEFEFKSEKQRL